jgi:hypothetical protein
MATHQSVRLKRYVRPPVWTGSHAKPTTVGFALRSCEFTRQGSPGLAGPQIARNNDATTLHPAILPSHHGEVAEGWYDFEFHLKDDPTRTVRLAVLYFHFAPVAAVTSE